MQLPELATLKGEIEKLEQDMSLPEVVRDARKMKELANEHDHKKNVAELLEKNQLLHDELVQAQELLNSEDEEMAELAQADTERIQEAIAKLDDQLKQALIPKDPNDSRDVILEIRAGAGGDEASLFATELFRAYTRYGELHGWKTHIISASTNETGGYKEVVAEISGNDVFGTLKFERGVHRVQRIPETEKQGRIHTSTITVAALPQAEEVDIEIRPEDLRIDTYRASGAGGQHVNKTDSAIRITHLPTNTVVAVQDERSQHKNREKAMRVLRSRILEEQQQKAQKEEAATRKEQVGTGDRSEKIRTYNFPQDRITDHRIKKSWSNIPGVLNGQLDEIFADIKAAQAELYEA